MKVYLEKIKLAGSPLTNKVYIGTINPNGTTWRNKIDVTDMFLDTVIKKWENQKEIISSGKEKWEISVKKIK